MNDEKTNKIMSSEELDDVLPKYEPIKLSGKNLAQNYVSAFNTGMNIYQCVNYLQGNIDWTIKAVNDVVKSWNTAVSETIDQTKAIARETTTEQFNTEWTNKQPELIKQVNTLTTNQFNNEKSIFNDELNALNSRMDTFSNPNLLINPDFKINQRGKSTYSTIGAGYTVDRWVGTNVKTVVNSDGTVSVSSLSGTGYYTQHEENISYGKHTYSIYVQAITGTVKAFYKSKDSKDVELGTLNQGLNTFTSVDDGFKSFYLSVAEGSSVTLKYAKVEQGTVATTFIAPNMAEELIKCYRFFQILNIDMLKISFNENQGFIPFTLKATMRSTPTLGYWTNKLYMRKSYTDMTLEELAFNSAWISGDTIIGVEFDVSYNRISMLTPIDNHLDRFELDAEIY